jgi:hypothetical protein
MQAQGHRIDLAEGVVGAAMGVGGEPPFPPATRRRGCGGPARVVFHPWWHSVGGV